MSTPTPERRLMWVPVEGAEELFTSDFATFLLALHDRFARKVARVRRDRASCLRRALQGGGTPGPPDASAANEPDWRVPGLPEPLLRPGIEVAGPAAITPMFINALNPGPDGSRAEGYLDDDEDAGGHCLADTVAATHNRVAAIEGTLAYRDDERGRDYRLVPGERPFLVHRERGWHLDEPEVTIDRSPVSATLLGLAATLFHVGAAHAATGESMHLYLPKCESVAEVALYREVFDAARDALAHLRDIDLRAIVLIESLPAVWQMEEMLFALGPYAAGLNAARWDLKASLLEFSMTDPAAIWPDRFDVDIKTTPFLADIFRRLVAVSLRHGAVPIGGMATALPSGDETVNRAAAAAIRADKEWEAQQGFLRAWVAHVFHMDVAGMPFREAARHARQPRWDAADPAAVPVRIEVPAGRITEEGTRRNLRTLLEYLEGWLRGRGAKGIDSLAGRPGVHPALMEDLATARISVAQTAQRVVHAARCEDTSARHDARLVRSLLGCELEDVLARLGGAGDDAGDRYERAAAIARHWIGDYLDLDFTSLGARTRADLLSRADTEPAL